MTMPNLKNINLPNINAVLFKDMRQKTKRSKLVVSVFLLNLLFSIIAMIILAVLAANAANYNTINYTVFQNFFIVLGFLEFGFIVMITPAITAGAITTEREKQTFDVLISTALTTKQIIRGKYWASILQIMLLIISGFPIYSLVFIYGGVSFFQALAVLLTLMLLTMYVAAIGIFWSSVSKKTIVATVLTYVILLSLMFGTMSLTATIKGVSLMINEVITSTTYNDPGLTGDWGVFVLYLNPLCTIYDSISGVFGIDIFSSTPGMSGIITGITDYSANNPLIVLWTPISIAIQILLSWWMLNVSANAIDPLRKKANKGGKKNKRKGQTA